MPKHIMVINDTQEILELFHEILSGEGYDVSIHSYSTRDLADVKRVKPDLIVSDHPPFREEQGWQFIQKLKMDRETARIPVIVCTTSMRWLRENVDEGWLTAKNISIVAKPFDVEELLLEVSTRLRNVETIGLDPQRLGSPPPESAEPSSPASRSEQTPAVE